MTTIKQFAESFDTAVENILLLMTTDKKFFSDNIHLYDKNPEDIFMADLSHKAVDALEKLLDKKDTIEIFIPDITAATHIEESTILSKIEEYKTDHPHQRINKNKNHIKFTVISSILAEMVIPVHDISVLHTPLIDSDTGNKVSDYDTSKDDTKTEQPTTADSQIAATETPVTNPEPAAKTPVAKPKKKKKSKYLMSAEKLAEISPTEMPMRDIRMFLTDIGIYELKDIAFMSDADILKTYNTKFMTVITTAGTLILPKEIVDQSYVIPQLES